MSSIKKCTFDKKEKETYKYISINSIANVPFLAIKYHYKYNKEWFNCNIAGDNKKIFFNKFGKSDYTWLTWYKSYNWFVEFMGSIFTISSSIRGTSYILVINKSNKDQDELCYLFCKEMDNFLNNN
jgi:hypothetical protein